MVTKTIDKCVVCKGHKISGVCSNVICIMYGTVEKKRYISNGEVLPLIINHASKEYDKKKCLDAFPSKEELFVENPHCCVHCSSVLTEQGECPSHKCNKEYRF